MPKAYTEKINSNTYSIKIGRAIPDKSVNLAYVHSKQVSPQLNVILSDYSDDIPGNPSEAKYTEKIMRADKNFRLTSIGSSEYLPSDEITITDEFSVPATGFQSPVPLYCAGELKHDFSLEGDGVCKYIGGYYNGTLDMLRKVEFSIEDDYKFIYAGKKIRIANEAGDEYDRQYKIVLVKNGDDKARVLIYANSDITGYSAIYESLDGQKTEKINVYPFFVRDDEEVNRILEGRIVDGQWNEDIYKKVYSVVEERGKYVVYAPAPTVIANADVRPAANFRYRVEAQKNVMYNKMKPGKINIGIFPVGIQSAKSIVQTAVISINNIMPKFISLENPHPLYFTDTDNNPKNNAEYWTIDLDMPIEHYFDYDVIIIAGKGAADLTRYNDEFKAYLENGGALWIDNNGNYGDSMILYNTTNGTQVTNPFAVDVRFSTTAIEDSFKLWDYDYMGMMSRFYNTGDIGATAYIGVDNVGPIMTFGETEIPSDWETISRYSGSNRAAVIAKRAFKRGLVVVSNCGILSGAVRPADLSRNMEFAINIVSVLGEDVWLTTPWVHDYVFHKDNIFRNELYSNGGDYTIISNPEDRSKTVAKKTISNTVGGLLESYCDVDYSVVDGNERYSVYIQQLLVDSDGKMSYSESQNVKCGQIAKGSDELYVYASSSTPNTFDLRVEGFDESDLSVFNDSLSFNFTVSSCVYEWSSTQDRYIKRIGNRTTFNSSVRKSDGIKAIGRLSEFAPTMPAGIEWADRGNTFFDVSLSYIDGTGAERFEDVPVTLYIYNVRTGKYFVSSAGNPYIPYFDLYDETDISDIYVMASTTFSTVMASKRTFGVISVDSSPIAVSIPDEVDSRDEWNVRIKNGIFSIASADSDIVTKSVYAVSEYDRQFFVPGKPYMRVEGERPVYLDYHKIKLGRKPVYYVSGNSTDEKLSIISKNTYRSSSFVGWLKQPAPQIKVDDTLIDSALYDVDFCYGVVKFTGVDVPSTAIVSATYSYNNINARRMIFSNSRAVKAVAQRSDANTFIAPNRHIYNTVAYVRAGDGYVPITDVGYTVSEDEGSITFNQAVSQNIYLDYMWYDVEELSITDVDVQNGIVYVDEHIDIGDVLSADYYYLEDSYNYRGYYDGNSFVKLDLNPSIGHTISVPKYHESGDIMLDDHGNIFYEEMPTSYMVNKSVYIYMLPLYKDIEYIARLPKGIIELAGDKISVIGNSTADEPMLALPVSSSVHENLIPIEYVDALAFLGPYVSGTTKRDFEDVLASNRFTIIPTKNTKLIPVRSIDLDDPNYDYITVFMRNSCNIRHTMSKKELDTILSAEPSAVLLCEAMIREHMNQDDIIVMDARKRGGGIVESLSFEDAKAIDDGASNYFDIGELDGIPYQKNGALIIKLPESVRQKFTDEQINEIVEKYVALGIQYIIEYVRE